MTNNVINYIGTSMFPTLKTGDILRVVPYKHKDIRIGDTVVVQRAGDVIPEVIAVVASKRTGKEQHFVMPTNCPERTTGRLAQLLSRMR